MGRTIHPSAEQKFYPFILLPSSPNLSKMRPGFLRTESPSTGVAHLPVRLSVAWLTKAWRAGVQSTWKGGGSLKLPHVPKALAAPLCRYGLDLLVFHYVLYLVLGNVPYPLGFGQWPHHVCLRALSGAFPFSALRQRLSLPVPRYLPQPVQQTDHFSWVPPWVGLRGLQHFVLPV